MDSSVTILVVDDEPAISDILKLLLEFDGFEVIVAQSGPEALAHLAASPIAAVLTDVRMPGMDGVELLREIRSFSAVPVIMMTGYSDLTREQVLDLGAQALIAKPFEHAVVLEALRELLSGPSLQPR